MENPLTLETVQAMAGASIKISLYTLYDFFFGRVAMCHGEHTKLRQFETKNSGKMKIENFE